MTKSGISLRNISKSFDGNMVLEHIDLDIAAGDIVGIVGENGAGKSTCMNILSGNLQPDSGQILLDGVETVLANPADGLEQGIRFIHQELSLAPSLTVAENIFLGDYLASRAGWIKHRAMLDAAEQGLKNVRASHIGPRDKLGTLRAGDQQLVEIAKALSGTPRLLIMDEPTSSLTEHEASALFDLVRELSTAGTSIIFITHRIEEVLAVCNRVVVLRDGKKVSDRKTPLSREDIIADMIGGGTSSQGTVDKKKFGPAVLRCENLSDGTLSGVNFDLAAGEVLGIFGLVGSGRTEILETIYGVRQNQGGELWMQSAKSENDSGKKSTGAKLQMVTESRKTSGIFPGFSLTRNITISSLDKVQRNGFVKSSLETDAATRLRDKFGIRAASLSMPITQLSGGNQQKALLARAFMAEPDILLLDEPTHGVDVGAKEEIYALIREMATSGVAVLMASSEVPELMAVVDRCIVLSQQEVVGILTRDQMSEESMLQLAFLKH